MAGTFEEKMAAMASMSQEEIADKVKSIKDVCKQYCGICPSYTGTGETELGFCATGKSDSITEEKGCICGGCPMTEGMSLRWGYYCTRGSGREQMESEKK